MDLINNHFLTLSIRSIRIWFFKRWKIIIHIVFICIIILKLVLRWPYILIFSLINGTNCWVHIWIFKYLSFVLIYIHRVLFLATYPRNIKTLFLEFMWCFCSRMSISWIKVSCSLNIFIIMNHLIKSIYLCLHIFTISFPSLFFV